MTAPDPRVGEIENRLAEITPGPWKAQNLEADHGHAGIFWVSVDRPDEVKTVAEVDANDDGVEAIWRFADAEFIAHAPADVAFLLAELRKAREALLPLESFRDLIMALAEKWEADFPSKAARLRAAVAAANGDGE